jgi:hypothetical protein
MTEAVCTGSGGNFQGGGTDCQSASCPVIKKGACCNDGVCTIETANDCGAFGGTYYGDDTLCFASFDVCAKPPTGGCCILGDCTTADEASCIENGGAFLGVGVSCDQGCPAVGACCGDGENGEGKCEDNVTEAACNAVVGAYQGDGSLCAESTCAGACCKGDGTCTENTTPEACGLLGFMGYGSKCDLVSCKGACCEVAGGCLDKTLDSCFADGGFFQGLGTDCANQACPELGACCTFSGLCLEVEKAVCSEGTFLSATSCMDEPCAPVGACCVPDNTCAVVSEDFCGSVLGGTYHGDSTTCPRPECQLITGVCCSADGGCSEMTGLECSSSESSDYLGDGTVCEAGICSYKILIFEDGFESGDTFYWSNTVP